MRSKATSAVSDARQPRCAPASCAPGAIYRHRVCRVQSALCRAAGRLGDLPRRGQPHRPLECLSGNRPARHPVFLRLQLHGAGRKQRGARLCRRRKRRGARGRPQLSGRIIRLGDQSPGAMREKARFVLGAMEQRMTALGFGWADVVATASPESGHDRPRRRRPAGVARDQRAQMAIGVTCRLPPPNLMLGASSSRARAGLVRGGLLGRHAWE
jgi:hypothetical protein